MNIETFQEFENKSQNSAIDINDDVNVDLILTGISGSLEVITKPNLLSKHNIIVESLFDSESWPLRNTEYDIDAQLKENVLDLKINSASTVLINSRKEFPEHMMLKYDIDPLQFIYTDVGPPAVDIDVAHNERTGCFDWNDVKVMSLVDKVKNKFGDSFADRAPAKTKQDFVRGRLGNSPFAAGGFIRDALPESSQLDGDRAVRELESLFVDSSRLCLLPPGYIKEADSKPVENIEKQFARIDLDHFGSTEVAAESQYEEEQVVTASAEHEHKKWARLCSLENTELEFKQVVKDPARKYPFELDLFQKQAIIELEKEHSVFISAHTSAGKTVVAEYAIALAMKHMTRAIYTSPIKALSNQKFRDFRDTFGKDNVGILTGDVQVKPDAPCLTMTTEILRSMLYRGADLIRDTEFVIFDEVHYVNDAERGVVWEEVIIMLPAHISLILLSATVPNSLEFAEWVGRTKRVPMTVIATQHRPVPLEHYLYYDKKLTLIVDKFREFQTSNYIALSREVSDSQGSKKQGARSYAGLERRDQTLFVQFVSFLKKKQLLPCIMFVFSKKKCEKIADVLQNTDLTAGASEKSEIHVFFHKAIARLSNSDSKLPQIQRVYNLIMRGIAVHHGGLLPILKEVIEMLFARGKISLLIATETFAMGVNAPARSVAFSSIRKHDGRDFRELLPGEYTQMSGRAGRRGLDSIGTVIILPSSRDGSVTDGPTLQSLILGTPSKLSSQFRLTYTMILNLLRVDAMPVRAMIERSFSENAMQGSKPLLLEKRAKLLACLKRLRQKRSSLKLKHWHEASQALDLITRLRELQYVICRREYKSLISFGRVIVFDWRPQIDSGDQKKLNDSGNVDGNGMVPVLGVALVPQGREDSFQVYALDPPADGSVVRMLPYGQLATAEPRSKFLKGVRVQLKHIVCVTRFALDRKTLEEASRGSDDTPLIEILRDCARQMDAGYAETDYSALRNSEFDFYETVSEKRQVLDEYVSVMERVVDTGDFLECLNYEDCEASVAGEIDQIDSLLSSDNLQLMPEYECKCKVLVELGYLQSLSQAQRQLGQASPNGGQFFVTLKGQLACEINTVDAVLLAELVLDQFFAPFDAAECVALLSALVFQEQVDTAEVELNMPFALADGLQQMGRMAASINEVQYDCGIRDVPLDLEAAKAMINPGLVLIVYQWSKGMAFDQIMQLTSVLEGAIVRTIVRLVETCREVRDAARVIGNPELYSKMEEATTLIKRDIVFAASLYL